MSAPALFDAVAATYDAVWTSSPAGRAQRDLVWKYVDPLFAPGMRILDFGCGTGEDAAHYTSRGAIVHAIDASAAMVEKARERGGFTVEQGDAAPREQRFDGALSNFGVLNCIEDLHGFAQELADVVAPGGPVAICVMSRFCLAETLRFAARFQFRKAARRWKGTAQFRGTTVYYRTASQMRRTFAPRFELRRSVAIGPPAGDHRLLIFERTSC